jgi:hypothetical protein
MVLVYRWSSGGVGAGNCASCVGATAGGWRPPLRYLARDRRWGRSPVCSQRREGSGPCPVLVPRPTSELLAAHPALGPRSASGPRLCVQPGPGRRGSGPRPSAHRQGSGRARSARVASNRRPPALPRVRG